jgi:hypothetical protein
VLGNTPMQPVDFFIERSKSFAFSVKVQHNDKTPFDFTGATVRCTIAQPKRRGGALVLTKSGSNVDVDGVRQFRLQAAELDLPPGEYPYDITLLTAEDYTVPLSKGVFVIGSNTDTVDSNVYNFNDPDQWITFTIKNNATIKVQLGSSLALDTVWLGGAPGDLSIAMQDAINDLIAVALAEYDGGGGDGGGGGGSFTGYNPIYALAYEN